MYVVVTILCVPRTIKFPTVTFLVTVTFWPTNILLPTHIELLTFNANDGPTTFTVLELMVLDCKTFIRPVPSTFNETPVPVK